MSDTKVRVRFAPSPTGPLHIGGVRTALYNYLFARKNKGTFILRIEDTDQTRFIDGAEEYIYQALDWCGITPDESSRKSSEFGPYKQSERKHIYKQYIDELIAKGHAYYAFDTPDELSEQRNKVSNWQYDSSTRDSMNNSFSLSEGEVSDKIANNDPYVVRFKMPDNEDVSLNDLIRGSVIFNTSILDDKVLYKSDGMPTYHLANIVDDHLMEISHVIRGEEWLPSSPLHVLLYRSFGWKIPEFAHLPLILKPDGPGKLSKRDGDRLGFPVFPIQWNDNDGNISSGFREKGYLADAFINILAFLGWNPGTEQEVFSMDELIQSFSIERVSKAGAKFDPDKARWYNQQYIKKFSDKELLDNIRLLAPPNISDDFLLKACLLMKERATFLSDIINSGSFFFSTPSTYDEKTVKKKWKENTHLIINQFIKEINDLDVFNAHTIENLFSSFIETKGIGIGQLMPNLRVLLTGLGNGPSLFEIMEIIGKEESIMRLKSGIISIQNIKAAI